MKAKHKSPAGKLQSLEVPMWPWDDIVMDFVVGMPRSPRRRNTIWVVVDRLGKVAHFIPIRSTSTAGDLAPIYMQEIVRLHGVPRTIVSDRDAKFVSKLWDSLQKALGTTLRMSTVLTPFLTRAKEGDFYEGKVADLKETKRCIRLESADGSPSDEPEEYAVKMLIHLFW